MCRGSLSTGDCRTNNGNPLYSCRALDEKESQSNVPTKEDFTIMEEVMSELLLGWSQ